MKLVNTDGLNPDFGSFAHRHLLRTSTAGFWHRSDWFEYADVADGKLGGYFGKANKLKVHLDGLIRSQ